ncbi:unnamed protein product [Bathycoccus prasinos]
MESPLPSPPSSSSSTLVVTAENALSRLRVVEEDKEKIKQPPPPMTPLSPIKIKTDEEETARTKKPTLLEKMRPTSLKTKNNENLQPSLRMRVTASTDELLNLEIREKNYRECRHEASTIYENFLYVGGDELVKKEKHVRKLKEELNVRRILCCYDNDSNNNNNGGLLNDECLSPGSCASGTSASTPTPRTTEGGSSSDDKFDSSTYFERMSLPLMDTSDEDIACVLYDAFDFMLGNERRECVWEKNINRREKEEEDDEEEKDDDEEGGCLVHCQMGCSRSVAICVAFVMWREGLAYDEAFERVKKARSIARPNIGFVKTLEAWHEARTNRSTSSSSSILSDVVSYRIVEHKNRKGYIVPKRENNTTTNNNSSYNNNNKDNNNNIGGGEGGMSPVSCCLSPKDDPNLVALRFKNETFFSKKNTKCDDDENTNDEDDADNDDKTFLQPTIIVGDRVDRENDPRVDEQTLDKITKQILFYEYGVRVSREF